jgi:DNA-directed RNA polymerase II subunit RPB7
VQTGKRGDVALGTARAKFLGDMFYSIDLTKELEIPPRFLGPKLKEEIFERLRHEVEGYCTGKTGFVLAVTSLYSIGQGMIREGVGNARFNVQYRCIAFMPHKGEVLDATVNSINKMGFFASAGPLQLFVSNHLIPEEFEFDTSNEPAYVTTEGEKIVPGSEVRVRIVGTRVDANEIFAVATMNDDFLGLMSINNV